MHVIFEKSVACTLVTAYFQIENSWFKISMDQGKHIVNEMDVLTHLNASNSTVWNIKNETPKLLQEIRVAFMGKVRKSENCAAVANLWKMSYQIVRDMWANTKKNFVLNLCRIHSDEEVLILAYDRARIRKNFCHKILDESKNEKVLGDVDYVPPVQWKDYIVSIEKTNDSFHRWDDFKFKEHLNQTDPLDIRVYWFMKNENNWVLKNPAEIWKLAIKSGVFDREEKKKFTKFSKKYQTSLYTFPVHISEFEFETWRKSFREKYCFLEIASKDYRLPRLKGDTVLKIVTKFVKLEAWWEMNKEERWTIAKIYGITDSEKESFFNIFEETKFHFPTMLQPVARMSVIQPERVMEIFVKDFPWYFYTYKTLNSRNAARKLAQQLFFCTFIQ